MINKAIPRLRFRGFNDKWKDTKLSNIAVITMGQSPLSKNYTHNPSDYLLVQGNADLHDGHIAPRLYTTQITKSSHKGNVILTVRAPVGATAINNYGDLVIGRGVASIQGNYFIYEFLNRARLLDYWRRYSTGSTFTSINSNILNNLSLNVPSLLEQHKIGTFFATLDQLIQLQQKKVTLLKRLKKAYLQKLFPRKNEIIPRIRFKGFYDGWKILKIKKLGKILTGNTPTKSNGNNYSNKGLLWITPTDINSRYITHTAHKLSKIGMKHAKVVPANSILITCIASIGKNALTATKSGFNQQINALVPKNKVNYYFLYVLSYFWSKYMQCIAPKEAMSIVNKKSFSNIRTKVPVFYEQCNIGNFFKNVDDLIQFQKDKLGYLQKLKKSYLQKMFC